MFDWKFKYGVVIVLFVVLGFCIYFMKPNSALEEATEEAINQVTGLDIQVNEGVKK